MIKSHLDQLSANDKKNSSTADNIEQITELFNKKVNRHKGWNLPKDHSICVLAITQENEAKSVQTRLYQEFPADEGGEIEVLIYGLIFVPGCAIIGLVKCDQATESRVPYI